MRLLLILAVLLCLTAPAFAAPSLTLSADKKKLASGESAVLTVAVLNPTADPERANLSLGYTVSAPLVISSAQGPKIIASLPASLTFDGGGPVYSNAVYFRLVGQTVTIAPVGSAITIPLGDFAPGDAGVATITVKNP